MPDKTTAAAPPASMKKTVRVTIEKVIEIELMPSMFGGLTEAEYIAQFKQGLWHIDGLDDIYTYAARMAAHHDGGVSHDGLGLLAAHYSTHPRVPDVKFRIIEDNTEDEIIENAPQGAAHEG